MSHSFRRLPFFAVLAASLACLGCSTGEGEGAVSSDQLFIDNCWNGPFELDPTFFAANPYRDQMMIRIQRGEDIQELSDGLLVLVDRVDAIRTGRLGEPIDVGLPIGVFPPGVPIEANPDPPLVSLSLYLHNSCHNTNSALYSIGGSITFESLFSGNPNETDADDRLTDARFEVDFADPRDQLATGEYPPGRVSRVNGYFRFFFQRGQPAQPFP